MKMSRTGIVTLCAVFAACCLAQAGMSSPGSWQTLWTTTLRGSIACSAQPVEVSRFEQRAAVACDPGWLVLLDSTGKVVWQRRLKDRAYRSPSAGDVDGDGRDEILVAGQSGRVYCFDVSGRLRWEFWLEGKLPDWYFLLRKLHGWAYAGSPRLADIDHDGRAEVIVGGRRGWVTCLDGRGNLIWRVKAPGEVNSTPCVRDIDGDAEPEVMFTCSNGKVYCLDAKGKFEWAGETAGDASRSNPMAVDLDGAGKLAVLAGTDKGRLVAIEARSGKILWSFESGGIIRSTLAAADLDGDGRPEILFGNEGDRRFGHADFYCLSAAGQERWRLRLDRQGGFDWPPIIADLDGDSQYEIAVTATRGQGLLVLNSDGKVEDQYDMSRTQGCSLFTGLGPDRRAKIVVTYDNSISCLNTGVESGSGGILRPQTSHKPTTPARAIRATAPGAVHRRQEKGTAASRLAIGEPAQIEGAWHQFTVSARGGPRAAALAAYITTPVGSRYGVIAHPDERKPLSASLRFEAFRDGRYTVEAVLTDGKRNVVGSAVSSISMSSASQSAARLVKLCGQIERSQAFLSRRNPGAGRHLARARMALERERSRAASSAGPSERAQRAYMAGLHRVIEQASNLVNWADAIARLQIEGGRAAFLAGWANPWAPFNPLAPPAEPLSLLKLDCYQGEYRSLAINMGNCADGELSVRARATKLLARDGSRPQPVGGAITLREVIPVATLRGASVWDALPLLNNAGTVRLPPWQSRQLWITIETARGKPGKYRAELTLDAVGRQGSARKVALNIHILPVRRPSKSPLAFVNWSSVSKWPVDSPARQAVTEDLVTHGTNVFVHIPAPPARFDEKGELTAPPDFSNHDAELKLLLGKGQVLFPSHWAALSGPSQPLSPTWKNAFRQYLPLWVAHLKELGEGYEDFALYPFDEAYGPFFDDLLSHARFVKEIDPRVRIYADLGGILPTSEQLLEARGCVDIYQPWQGHFEDEAPAWLGELKKTGKPVWMYRESNNMKELSPLGYYRRMPWLAWERGLTGFGIYCYIYGDPWMASEWDSNEFGLVYPTESGVAPSKRWEAVREGIQDYEALWLLRRGVAAARKEGRDVSGAARLLNEAPKRVLESGVRYDVLSGYRQRIVEATLRLTSSGALARN
jgi:outer membrane protein assembly factor BamB